MWIYCKDDFRFLEVNDAAIGLYGYTRAEFMQMTILDIRPEEDITRVQENRKRPETPGYSPSGISPIRKLCTRSARSWPTRITCRSWCILKDWSMPWMPCCMKWPISVTRSTAKAGRPTASDQGVTSPTILPSGCIQAVSAAH